MITSDPGDSLRIFYSYTFALKRLISSEEVNHIQTATLLMLNVNINGRDVYHTHSLYTISGGFSDSDLIDVSKDDSYKPDKGKGNVTFWNGCTYQATLILLLPYELRYYYW